MKNWVKAISFGGGEEEVFFAVLLSHLFRLPVQSLLRRTTIAGIRTLLSLYFLWTFSSLASFPQVHEVISSLVLLVQLINQCMLTKCFYQCFWNVFTTGKTFWYLFLFSSLGCEKQRPNLATRGSVIMWSAEGMRNWPSELFSLLSCFPPSLLISSPACWVCWPMSQQSFLTSSYQAQSQYFFLFFFLYFLLMFKNSCLHFPHTTPLTHPPPPPTINLIPLWFVYGSFIHVPWWPFPFFPPLSPSPLIRDIEKKNKLTFLFYFYWI